MLIDYESICFQNVVSKMERFHYLEMPEKLEAFKKDIQNAGATPVGPLFYAIYNVPSDENLTVEFFMPVEEMKIKADNLLFRSLYSVENMTATYVCDDFQNKMEGVYAQLMESIKMRDLEITTPIFHMVSNDGKYIKVLIGHSEEI